MAKRAVLYGRVSSKHQQEKGHRLPEQFKEMRAYAEKNGFEIVSEYEEAYTATEPFRDRPMGGQIYDLAARNRLDVIIVHTQDRLTRGDLETEFPIDLGVLLADMREYGIEIHSVDDGRLNEDIGVFLNGWLAKKENQDRAKKSKEGRRGKIAKGLWPGNGSPLYGYDVEGWQKTAKLVINKQDAEIIKLIFSWYVGGVGVQEIADRLTSMGVERNGSHNDKNALNKWLPGHVYPILKNETYAGTFWANKYVMVKVPGQRKKKRALNPPEQWKAVNVPAIIDREIWEKAQRRLSVGREMSRRSSSHEYLIGRRVKCECGYNVQGKPCHTGKGRVYLYYMCNGRFGNLTVKKCAVNLPSFRADKVDTAVWSWVQNLLDDPIKLLVGFRLRQEELGAGVVTLQAELAQVEKRIADEKSKLEKLVDLYIVGSFDMDILNNRKRTLETALDGYQNRARQLQAEIAQKTITDEQIADFASFVETIRSELVGQILKRNGPLLTL